MSRRKKKSNFGKIAKIILGLILIFIVVVFASMTIAKKITHKEPENEVTNEQAVQNVVEDNKVAKIEEDKDYIYEKDKFEISEIYNTEMPNDKYTTTIQLPFINLESDAVNKLNTEFKNTFEKAKKSAKLGNDGYGLEVLELNYKSSVIDDKFISLAVNTGTLYVPGDSNLPTTIYNIDIETGELMSNDEVLKKLDLTMEDLEGKIEKAMKEVYEEAKREEEEDFVYSEILEVYSSEEALIKAAKTNYANTKLYVLDNKTIAMELNYKNIDSLKTWTQISID